MQRVLLQPCATLVIWWQHVLFATKLCLLQHFLDVAQGLKVCSGHAIPASVPPSSGNMAAAPPCSPPTSTPHVSRLTGAIRVRRFYLESFAVVHWCLGRSSPTLYRSEMAGVSRGSSAMPPWPTATPLRRCNPSVTYLHRCGIHVGALGSAGEAHRQRAFAGEGVPYLWVADVRDPLSVTQRSPPLFYSNPDFLQSCKNHIFSF